MRKPGLLVHKRSIDFLILAAAAIHSTGAQVPPTANVAKPEPATQRSGAPANSADAKSTTGTVEGVVIYEADSKRPWRYGRY